MKLGLKGAARERVYFRCSMREERRGEERN